MIWLFEWITGAVLSNMHAYSYIKTFSLMHLSFLQSQNPQLVFLSVRVTSLYLADPFFIH